jgi:hypothetical protein
LAEKRSRKIGGSLKRINYQRKISSLHPCNHLFLLPSPEIKKCTFVCGQASPGSEEGGKETVRDSMTYEDRS